MRNEHIKDYLWSEMVPSINNKRLINNCLIIEKFLEGRLDKDLCKEEYLPKQIYREKWDRLEFSSITGKIYSQYNTFTFPSVDLVFLYQIMKRLITPVLDPNEHYLMQSWLNVYRENNPTDWHGHWRKECRAIHGFYCVNVEDTPSYTEYKFPTLNEDILTVDSRDGLLVFGKSKNYIYRSSQGWSSINPRITIAFDIIPATSIQEDYKDSFFERYPHNHYFPF